MGKAYQYQPVWYAERDQSSGSVDDKEPLRPDCEYHRGTPRHPFYRKTIFHEFLSSLVLTMSVNGFAIRIYNQ